MSRLEQIVEPGDNEALKAAYAATNALGWMNAKGEPDNFCTSFSARPDLLQMVAHLTKGLIMEGELPPTVKCMVFYAIAYEAKCEYCVEFNQHALQEMGVPDDVIASCVTDPELAALPPAQRKIVKFGLRAAKNPQGLTDADFQELKDLGISDGEIAELVMMAGFAALLDIWADAIQVENDH
jgi:alkylhydroperoxidase family enzyme